MSTSYYRNMYYPQDSHLESINTLCFLGEVEDLGARFVEFRREAVSRVRSAHLGGLVEKLMDLLFDCFEVLCARLRFAVRCCLTQVSESLSECTSLTDLIPIPIVNAWIRGWTMMNLDRRMRSMNKTVSVLSQTCSPGITMILKDACVAVGESHRSSVTIASSSSGYVVMKAKGCC